MRHYSNYGQRGKTNIEGYSDPTFHAAIEDEVLKPGDIVETKNYLGDTNEVLVLKHAGPYVTGYRLYGEGAIQEYEKTITYNGIRRTYNPMLMRHYAVDRVTRHISSCDDFDTVKKIIAAEFDLAEIVEIEKTVDKTPDYILEIRDDINELFVSLFNIEKKMEKRHEHGYSNYAEERPRRHNRRTYM